MKRYISMFLISLILVSSCKNDDDITSGSPNLIGKWELIERLLDPGDGSGVFIPVQSDMTLEFRDENTVEIKKGNLCSFSMDLAEDMLATYSPQDKTIDPGCFNGWVINFEINEGFLELNFPCFERCSYKFRKI